MDEVRKVLFCVRANLSKWKRNPVVLSLALCWFSLIYDWCIPLTRFCFAVDARITPWLFPFLMQPHAIIIYVVLLTLFFAHAPFCNQHSPLTMIRMSKRTWFIGQVAYIAAASLMATLFTLGSMLLVLAPWLGFSINWGGVLQSLAEHTIRLEDYGLQMKAGPYLPLMVEYGPLEATVQTLLLTGGLHRVVFQHPDPTGCRCRGRCAGHYGNGIHVHGSNSSARWLEWPDSGKTRHPVLDESDDASTDELPWCDHRGGDGGSVESDCRVRCTQYGIVLPTRYCV